MNLPLPNLDDRTYADLVQEAIAQIPLEYKEWTDHNPTDTGIILIELLAWLTEMTLYQVNQIPDENRAIFVSLLKGEQWNLPNNISAQARKQILQSEIKKTLSELRHRYRAVTAEDYEQLVLEDWNESQQPDGLKIARAKCLAQRDLELFDTNTVAKGHISLVVIPEDNKKINRVKNPYPKLKDFLDDRKLLTTRLHIDNPEYVSIAITADLIIKDGANPEKVKKQAEAEVQMFFSPLNSGTYWQGKGWEFGRSVYISELYKLLDDLEGVDYVKKLQINQDNSISEIELADNQLVDFQLENSEFIPYIKVGNKPIKIQ